mmetsp:Transcript_40383/g.111159  ORF Transcript_40383/g.111159 Transcript_40383/m.111159 type:complete len:254 (+) Transcript_40383:260-1021(+)
MLAYFHTTGSRRNRHHGTQKEACCRCMRWASRHVNARARRRVAPAFALREARYITPHRSLCASFCLRPNTAKCANFGGVRLEHFLGTTIGRPHLGLLAYVLLTVCILLLSPDFQSICGVEFLDAIESVLLRILKDVLRVLAEGDDAVQLPVEDLLLRLLHLLLVQLREAKEGVPLEFDPLGGRDHHAFHHLLVAQLTCLLDHRIPVRLLLCVQLGHALACAVVTRLLRVGECILHHRHLEDEEREREEAKHLL